METIHGRSYAAVAIILRNLDRSPEVILVKRASRLDDPWSGQIAFPGGRRKPSDQSLVQTALRELKEETGVGEEAV
ncbi:MAG: NUDIX domain-containing protein, partial [Candidatus Caldarchaeum sp.]